MSTDPDEPMADYHLFGIRSPSGGGFRGSAGGAAGGAAAASGSGGGVPTWAIVVLVCGMVFLVFSFAGVTYYRNSPRRGNAGCCKILWRALRFALLIRLLEKCIGCCCCDGEEEERSRPQRGARSAHESNDAQWYTWSTAYPNDRPNELRIFHEPPSLYEQSRGNARVGTSPYQNTAESHGYHMTAPPTYSGSTLDETTLPAVPSRARIHRTASAASTLVERRGGGY